MFDVTTSDQSFEEDVELTGYGLFPVKGENTSTTYDSMSQGPVTRYTMVAYSSGYIVTYEEISDNLYKERAFKRAGALAFAGNQTVETVAANIYNRGFSSSYTYGDGKEMLATDHPTLSGNQQNELTTAADLSEASLEDLFVLIMKAKNNRGLQISLMPKCLVVPPDLWFEANRILKSSLQNDTANNAVNVMKATNALPGGIKVNHYLTDPDAWFVRSNCPDGQRFFWREKPWFKEDNDFDTSNQKAKMYFRFDCGSTDFRGVYGSAGA